MAYSTIAQLRANVPRVTSSVLNDASVTDRIAFADAQIEVDLSNVVDFTDMPAIDESPATPDYINKLSQYKTAEMSLIAIFSSKRMNVEVTDWQYWQQMYDKLLQAIISGTVDLDDFATGTTLFSSDSYPKSDIEPALGQGEYGEWVNDDDLEAIRDEYGAQED